eukprot:Rhum_TRINITY_DN17028_c0_g1::Rhum_TRINITY_DN17028_c0_g1_i1::g.164991::m.164991
MSSPQGVVILDHPRDVSKGVLNTFHHHVSGHLAPDVVQVALEHTEVELAVHTRPRREGVGHRVAGGVRARHVPPLRRQLLAPRHQEGHTRVQHGQLAVDEERVLHAVPTLVLVDAGRHLHADARLRLRVDERERRPVPPRVPCSHAARPVHDAQPAQVVRRVADGQAGLGRHTRDLRDDGRTARADREDEVQHVVLSQVQRDVRAEGAPRREGPGDAHLQHLLAAFFGALFDRRAVRPLGAAAHNGRGHSVGVGERRAKGASCQQHFELRALRLARDGVVHVHHRVRGVAKLQRCHTKNDVVGSKPCVVPLLLLRVRLTDGQRVQLSCGGREAPPSEVVHLLDAVPHVPVALVGDRQVLVRVSTRHQVQ